MAEKWHRDLLIRYLSPDRRFRLYLFLLFLQVFGYTVLIYYLLPLLEGVSLTWLESLYFVVMTITTVGYSISFPLTNDITLALVIMIIVTGVFTVLMIVPVMLGPYLTDFLRASPPRRTPVHLRNHVIIMGFGELTRALIESLMISSHPIVVVEADEDRAREVQRIYHRKVAVVYGDYADDNTWKGAFVQDASDIILCEDERTNATVCLGIGDLTEGRIIAVVDDLSYDRYLRYAGVEYVLSPKNFTGRILARHAVLSYNVDTIYETVSHESAEMPAQDSFTIIKVPVMEGCHNIGRTLEEIDLGGRYKIEVLFLWKKGEFIMHPSESDIIDASTMLFLIGHPAVLRKALIVEFGSEKTGPELAVIAGFGDVGQSALRELEITGNECILIDPGIEGDSHVRGNAEEEAVLTEAHIQEAHFCVVAVNDDNVNIFTTLVARNLNPSLRIVARANQPSSVDRLYRAGADYVALLPTIGGQVIAGIVLADTVKVLLDLPDGQKVVMKRMMKHAPSTVGWVEGRTGTRIIGVEGTAHSVIRPGKGEPVYEGDAVIVAGTTENLKSFCELI